MSKEAQISRASQIEIYVRHSPKCPHKVEPHFRECMCPKWLYFRRGRRRISAKSRTCAGAELVKFEMEKREVAKRYGLPPVDWNNEIADVKAELKRLSMLIESGLASLKRTTRN